MNNANFQLQARKYINYFERLVKGGERGWEEELELAKRWLSYLQQAPLNCAELENFLLLVKAQANDGGTVIYEMQLDIERWLKGTCQ